MFRGNRRGAAPKAVRPTRWITALGVWVVGVLALPAPCSAQSETDSGGRMSEAVRAAADARLWGTAVLRDGRTVTGFLVWDHDEATRWDLLDAERRTTDAERERWEALAREDVDSRDRSLEFLGVRLTWKEDDDAYPTRVESPIRMGHVTRIVPSDEGASIELRSGDVLELVASGSDLGKGMRGLRVEPLDAPVVVAEWDEIEEVTFGTRPVSAFPTSTRLHGTLETRSGDRFTGWVSWDADEAFEADTLDGDDRSIAFGEIATVERTARGARVVPVSGDEFLLSGTNDVNRENRGIRVSDPSLGQASVDWDEFESLRLHPPVPDDLSTTTCAGAGYDGGSTLRGSVTTEAGNVHRGRIVWDMDETSTREMLNGTADGVDMDIEFGCIAEISKLSRRGARVTLRDGRSFELEGSNDVDASGKGTLIVADDGTEIWLDWDGFRTVTLGTEGDGR